MEALEIYLQILYPALKFNLIMQRKTSTIADVLPSLMMILTKWARMVVPFKYKNLCINLIKAFRHKFEFELNSPIYHVAALFNVSKFFSWQHRPDCKEIFDEGVKNIVAVVEEFCKRKDSALPNSVSTESCVSGSLIDSLDGMFADDDYRDSARSRKKFSKKLQIYQVIYIN